VCVAVGQFCWVVVVWVWAGGWVVCVCGAGVYCCHTNQCARWSCRPQAEKNLVQFCCKAQSERDSYRQQVVCYISAISDYIPSYPIISHHIPPYPITISHHIKTGIFQRYTPEGGLLRHVTRPASRAWPMTCQVKSCSAQGSTIRFELRDLWLKVHKNVRTPPWSITS